MVELGVIQCVDKRKCLYWFLEGRSLSSRSSPAMVVPEGVFGRGQHLSIIYLVSI